VRVDDGDGPAVGVDSADLGEFHLDARAREHLVEGADLELLADRELVHPDAFDEVGLGVDEGDGDVCVVQPLGEAPGGDGSGVAGSEDDDAVLHFLLLSARSDACPCSVTPLEPGSPRFPDSNGM
jgi:hypothetical protein